ncbi:MAG: hypothetical protein ACP5LH_03310 [Candidatus Micrarchaeia archaeon]
MIEEVSIKDYNTVAPIAAASSDLSKSNELSELIFKNLINSFQAFLVSYYKKDSDKTFNKLLDIIKTENTDEYNSKVANSIYNIMSYLGYTDNRGTFINSFSDEQIEKNNNNIKLYLDKIILINENLKNDSFFNFFQSLSSKEFSNYLYFVSQDYTWNIKFDDTPITLDGLFLSTVHAIFRMEDFSVILENIKKLDQSKLKILFKSVYNLEKDAENYRSLYYFNAFKYNFNYDILLNESIVDIIKNETFNSIPMDSRAIIIFADLYQNKNKFEDLAKILIKKDPNLFYIFLNTFSLVQKDDVNIINTVYYDIYDYLLDKKDKSSRKFDKILENFDIIIKLSIELSCIYNNSKSYKDLDYIIENLNKNRLSALEQNLKLLMNYIDGISNTIKFIREEKDNIDINLKIELLNKIGNLFRLYDESKLDNKIIKSLIKNFEEKIGNISTPINYYNNYKFDQLIKEFQKFAPNTASYILYHRSFDNSLLKNNDKLISLIIDYLKIQLEGKTTINLDKINAVVIEIEKGKKGDPVKKYEEKFIADFERRVNLAKIELKNRKIKNILDSSDLYKNILSKIIGIDTSEIKFNDADVYFSNVLVGYISGIKVRNYYNGKQSIDKTPEHYVKELIKKYYNGGNDAALEYISNIPKNKVLIKKLNNRKTNLDALRNFELTYKIKNMSFGLSNNDSMGIREIDNILRSEQTFTFYISQNIMENLNQGVYFDTCLNIVDGNNAFAAVARAISANNFTLYITEGKKDNKIIGRISLVDSDQGLLVNSKIYIDPKYKDIINGEIIIDVLKKLADASNRSIIYYLDDRKRNNVLDISETLNKMKNEDTQILNVKNLEVNVDFGLIKNIYSDILGGLINSKEENKDKIYRIFDTAYLILPKNGK